MATSTQDAPSERLRFASAWTGTEMIVWGGTFYGDINVYYDLGDGSRYDPQQDVWTQMSETGAPSARDGPVGRWTGSRLIVWGGSPDGTDGIGTGALYEPVADTWVAMSLSGAPAHRHYHAAVWTGTEMIVWGGSHGGTLLADGARYHPLADSWSPMSSAGAPTPRAGHTAVWTGSDMIVWGGAGPADQLLDTGGIYDPSTDTWKAMSSAGAPSPRYRHTAVWTGSEMIVWGGMTEPSGPYFGDGARYDPATDTWAPVTDDGAPEGRTYHTAAWTGSRMIVWGGWPPQGDPSGAATGGLYDPAADSWQPTSTCGAPHWSWMQGGVWTGTQLIVWGGDWGSVSQGGAGLGGVYTPP